MKNQNNGRGQNTNGSDGVISNGSKIFVPENTAAFIFSQAGIENIITTPGGYEYQDGEASIFNGDGVKKSIFKQVGERIGYGGISSTQKEIAFVNLREIRDIKFGTRGPQVYNDIFYGIAEIIDKFSDKVLKRLFVLNYAPNSMWTYFTSVYFMHYKDEDGSLEDDKFYTFLCKTTAFVWAYALTNPGLNSLRTPIFAEMVNIIKGKDVVNG